jgi:hypothetical protein
MCVTILAKIKTYDFIQYVCDNIIFNLKASQSVDFLPTQFIVCKIVLVMNVAVIQ